MGDEDLPAAATQAAAMAACALMRTAAAGEEGVMTTLAAAAIVTAERFCGRQWIARDGDGGAGWDGVPAPVRQGIAMLIQYLFEDRGRDEVPPAAVAALWRPFRQMRLAP